MNLPNRLTIARVIMIPIFVVFLLGYDPVTFPWGNYIAVGVFLIACITDFFDGRIARKRNLVTNFGKFMDPLADKLLVCSALICLCKLDMIPTWIVLIIVAREFIISGFRLVAAEQNIVLAASMMAKFKTAFQMIMVIVLVLELDPRLSFLFILGEILIYSSLALTVASLVEYIIKNRKILKGGY